MDYTSCTLRRSDLSSNLTRRKAFFAVKIVAFGRMQAPRMKLTPAAGETRRVAMGNVVYPIWGLQASGELPNDVLEELRSPRGGRSFH